MKIVIQQVALGRSQSVEYWKGSYIHKELINKMMFITDGHPVALEDILGWMILSGEDIADIRCFLVGLVTGDNWQYDHGDNSHKKMTEDNWQNNHGDNSQCRETASSCNRCSGRLGPKANLLIYEVVQGEHHEEPLLLQ
jgi:hypothetical protein